MAQKVKHIPWGKDQVVYRCIIWEKYLVVGVSSRRSINLRSIKWEKYQVGEVSCGQSIKWEKYQVRKV